MTSKLNVIDNVLDAKLGYGATELPMMGTEFVDESLFTVD